MTTTINRRTALLGTVTLPAAMAPLGMAQAMGTEGEPDPFIDAFCAYVDAEIAYTRSFDLPGAHDVSGGDAIVAPYSHAAAEARLRMAETVPTTPMGLMLAINALLPVFGEPKDHGRENLFDFDCMMVPDDWANGAGEALLRSLRAGAEKVLAGGAV